VAAPTVTDADREAAVRLALSGIASGGDANDVIGGRR